MPIKTRATDTSPPRNWWREPLLHFAVLGAALFGLDQALQARTPDAHTIVVDAGVAETVQRTFRAQHRRDPNAQEMPALIERWIQDEVVFREGLSLGVDQGDSLIRQRVIDKSLLVLDAGLNLPQANDAQLQQWFEGQRRRYDQPLRLDFQEAESDATSQDAAQAVILALNQPQPQAVDVVTRDFRDRPVDKISERDGADFAQGLASGPLGVWRALPALHGTRLVRLQAVRPARPAVFSELREVVAQDWADAMRTELRAQAVRERASKYRLKFEHPTPRS